MTTQPKTQSVPSLFLRTIGKRVGIAMFSTPVPETMDADGSYRTVVFKRPGADESQALADFQAVRADLIQRRHISLFRVEWVIFALLLSIIIVNIILAGGRASLPFLLSMIPILLLFISIATYRAYLRTTRLETAEEHIAAAWLRSGVPLLSDEPMRKGINAHRLPDAALRTRMANRAARRSADRLERQLMELSEHSLRDIGLKRHQIPDVVNEHLTRLSVSLPL